MGQPDWSAPGTDAALVAMQAQLAIIQGNTSPINNPLQNTTAVAGVVAGIIRTAVGREAVVLYNLDTAITVWVGGAGVAVGNGVPLLPGAFHSWALDTESLYGVTPSGTVTVTVTYATVSN